MGVRWTIFAALLLVALTLVPGGAHILSLPNKIGMSAADYLVAQQAYRGWAYAGVFVLGALVATGILAYQVRHWPALRTPAFVALGCLLATQVVFWTFDFPANQQTANWTVLPANWELLRLRWEIGHALSAALTLAALVALLVVDMRAAPMAPAAMPAP